MVLQQGEKIGPYTIIDQIGQGGMATVYRAEQAKLGREVAIKVLHQNFLEDKGLLSRFEREARIIASLDHPHIVPIYDYDEEAGQPYLVMKLVPGVTLKDILAEDTLPLADVLQIMTSVADGLTYAHQHGVLHRDIKPSNIVIDDNGIPYLTDFGLARIVQSGESTLSAEMMLGTPHYISPEQAKGERDLDGRTDVYSLGIILYEMIVGRVPYTGDTPYAIVHHHIYSAPPRPSDINPNIPPQVDGVLLRALAKNPADRYQTPNDLIVAFRQAVEETGMGEYKADRSTAGPVAYDDYHQTPDEGVEAPVSYSYSRGRGRSRRRKQVVIERRFDAGQVQMGDIGRRIESGVRQGAGFVSNLVSQIQEQIDKERRPLSEEEIIRQRIERRDRARQGFVIHLIVFILINAMFWTLWGMTPEMASMVPATDPQAAQVMEEMGNFPWPIFITLPWMIGLVAHLLSYYSKHGGGARRREREIQREIERSRQLRAYYADEAKRKNDDYAAQARDVRLTGDGELTDSFAQQWDTGRKRKRR